MLKDLRLNIRLTAEEKEMAEKKAEKLEISLSDFARNALIDACNENKNTDYSDISMQLITYSYYLIDKLAKGNFDVEEVNKVKEKAKKAMESWGYKTIE